MTALVFSVIAALFVWLAGRRDPVRDPRLTTLALALTAVAPCFPLLPKFYLIPAALPAAEISGAAGGWMGWIGGVWLAGAIVALMRVGAGMLRLARWRRDSTPVGRVAIGGRREAELRLLAGLRSPVAAGIFRPVVYLPAAWDHWPEEVRAAVLAHEIAHLNHRDPLRRLVAALACAVHWFNPLVFWMARRLEAQCEFHSDARVLAAGVPAADYARLLCDLADTSRQPLAAVAMARAGGLEQRIERLLAARAPAAGRRLLDPVRKGFAHEKRLLSKERRRLAGTFLTRFPPNGGHKAPKNLRRTGGTPALLEAAAIGFPVTPTFSNRVLLALLAALTLVTAAGLALLGPAAPVSAASFIDPAEVRLRLSADPFPGNP